MTQFCQKAMCQCMWRDIKNTMDVIWTILLGLVLLWLHPPVWVLSILTSPTHQLSPHPIDRRVELLDANDSTLILIRETHQIQTIPQISTAWGDWGSYCIKRLLAVFFPQSKFYILNFNCIAMSKQTHAKDLSLVWKLIWNLHNIITGKGS